MVQNARELTGLVFLFSVNVNPAFVFICILYDQIMTYDLVKPSCITLIKINLQKQFASGRYVPPPFAEEFRQPFSFPVEAGE